MAMQRRAYTKVQSSFVCVFVNSWGSSLSFPVGASGKESACQCRRRKTQMQSLGLEDPLEKEIATHHGILAWRIS